MVHAATAGGIGRSIRNSLCLRHRLLGLSSLLISLPREFHRDVGETVGIKPCPELLGIALFSRPDSQNHTVNAGTDAPDVKVVYFVPAVVLDRCADHVV